MQRETNLVVANQTDSLRTTVPGIVVELCELHAGDKLRWIIDAKSDPPTISIVPSKLDPEARAKQDAKREVRAEKRRATIRRKE